MRRTLTIVGVVLAGVVGASVVGTASATGGFSSVNYVVQKTSPEAFVCSYGNCIVKKAVAKCPAHSVPLGGGFIVDPNDVFVPTVFESLAVHVGSRLGWAIVLGNNSTHGGGFKASVMCGEHVAGAADAAAPMQWASPAVNLKAFRQAMHH